jgi:predicted SnoaL-like aldol condensation-catalyzing enzyme
MTTDGDVDLARNKRVVEHLFEVIYGNGDDLDVLDELVAEDYIQHNPQAGQGRAGLKRFFAELVPLPPWLDASGAVTVNLIAQGDLVVRQEIRTHGMLVDVFRVRDGLCVEHWDAFRPDPGTERIPGF